MAHGSNVTDCHPFYPKQYIVNARCEFYLLIMGVKRDLPQYISFIIAVGYCVRKRHQSLANFITLISFECSLQTIGNRTHNFCGDN